LEYRWVVLTVTCVGAFMANLDARIVIVGLPTIGRQLGIGLTELIWVTQAYVFMITIFSLLLGRVTDIIGRLKLYKIGFGIFTIGSALSAISFTGIELIASRAIQGVGGAMIIGNSAAMLTDVAKGNDLGTLLGANMLIGSIGSFAGLTLSGIILAITDWRGLFYINVPIGILGVIWAHKRLHEISLKDPEQSIDWMGFLTFSTGLALILLALTFLSYGLSELTLGTSMMIVGVLLIYLFVWIEAKTRAPLLDLTLFKIRRFAGGNCAFILQSTGWLAMTVLSPFYLQLGLGLSALETGLDLLPIQAVLLVTTFLGGWLSDKYGRANTLAAVSIVIDAVGMILMASVATNANQSQFIAALAVTAVGAGLYIGPNTSDVMSSVAAERRGVASGVRATIQYVANTSSYGLVVLLLTLAIPYGTLTTLIQSSVAQIDALAQSQFLEGTRLTILVLAIVNMVALAPQLLVRSKQSDRSLELQLPSSIDG